MSKDERTGKRDLTFNFWHRYTLGEWATTIDIDWCEWCQRCWQPIALIETARDNSGNGYNKPFYITRNLAVLARLPAYTVLWKPNPSCPNPKFGPDYLLSAIVTRVNPNPTKKIRMSEYELRCWYRWLHRGAHQCLKSYLRHSFP